MKLSYWYWAGGFAAAVAAGLAMWLIRAVLQIRSIPERLLEWLLLFVPLDVFESALQRFGFSAKVYSLYLAVAIMLGLLAWLGAVALRRRWPVLVLLGLGLGLWLFTMVVIMPLTSAGYFAMALLEGTRATIGGYLGVGLMYGAVLTLIRVYLVPRRTGDDIRLPGGQEVPARRYALSLFGGSVAVLAVSYVLELLVPHRTGLPTIVVADPQEPVPSGGLNEANPHPNAVSSPSAVAAPGRAGRGGDHQRQLLHRDQERRWRPADPSLRLATGSRRRSRAALPAGLQRADQAAHRRGRQDPRVHQQSRRQVRARAVRLRPDQHRAVEGRARVRRPGPGRWRQAWRDVPGHDLGRRVHHRRAARCGHVARCTPRVRDERSGPAARAWLPGAAIDPRPVWHEERQVGRRVAADAARIRRLVRPAI